MIGGLIEEQRLGLSEERLSEQHADALVARDLAHLALVTLVGDVESLEQDRRVALRRVAVLLPDDALELAEPDAILVREVGLLVERIAFLKRGPQPCIPHDHCVDDAERLERELVLADQSDLLRPDDGALLGIEVARQDLHERGLAGAVRPRQPVAPARRERDGHVLEEHLRAEAHGHVGDGNHRTVLRGLSRPLETSHCTRASAGPLGLVVVG